MWARPSGDEVAVATAPPTVPTATAVPTIATRATMMTPVQTSPTSLFSDYGESNPAWR